MQRIEVGQRWNLRNGEAMVDIVATDLTDSWKGQNFRVGGVVRYRTGEVELMAWDGEGNYSPHICASGLDLHTLVRDRQPAPTV